MALHSIGYMARLHGVSPSTIRRWEAAGLIGKALRTLGGHRRFLIEDSEEKGDRKVVGYARVSSHDQKSDPVRQIEHLKAAGCDEVLSDIGSGLNCKKPGLRRLMRMILDGRVAKLVVLHEDRLLRFGVPLRTDENGLRGRRGETASALRGGAREGRGHPHDGLLRPPLQSQEKGGKKDLCPVASNKNN